MRYSMQFTFSGKKKKQLPKTGGEHGEKMVEITACLFECNISTLVPAAYLPAPQDQNRSGDAGEVQLWSDNGIGPYRSCRGSSTQNREPKFLHAVSYINAMRLQPFDRHGSSRNTETSSICNVCYMQDDRAKKACDFGVSACLFSFSGLEVESQFC